MGKRKITDTVQMSGSFTPEEAAEQLRTNPDEDHLWDAMMAYSGYEFQTVNGLTFTYTIRGHEVFVDRKGKSITRATVNLAFARALALGDQATGPKKLGCFGASYLYPIFMAFGMISVPGKRGKDSGKSPVSEKRARLS